MLFWKRNKFSSLFRLCKVGVIGAGKWLDLLKKCLEVKKECNDKFPRLAGLLALELNQSSDFRSSGGLEDFKTSQIQARYSWQQIEREILPIRGNMVPKSSFMDGSTYSIFSNDENEKSQSVVLILEFLRFNLLTLDTSIIIE